MFAGREMMNRGIIVIYILFLFGTLLINVNNHTYAETLIDSTAVKGISQLEYDNRTPKEQKVSLQGEWEFYWQQLLDPEDIKYSNLRPDYIQVPSSWRGQIINDVKLTNYGYGTYRLKIKLPSEDIGKNKALYLRYIGSAYQLWVDGVKKDSIGVVGKSIDDETPKLRLNLVFFEPKQEIVEILIQVSNYSFREGGIFGEVSYGDTQTLIVSILKDFTQDIFIIGGFFFIGLYHLIIFGVRKQELSILLIGLAGVVTAVRTLLLSEYLVFLLLPIISWELMVKIEYLVEIAGFMLLILLMKHMYPKEVHNTPLVIAYGFSVLCSGYILLTPARIFTETMLIHVTIMASILLYFVFYVGILAVFRKREGARINLMALFMIIVGMCNDALYFSEFIDTVAIMEYCVFLFFLLQAVIISYRYSLLFNKNKTLTAELVQINNTLEEKVYQRTKELHEKNEELFQQATIDGLTGVFNRKYFLDLVREQLKEKSSGISLLLLDIDDFKQINDKYGHMAGDQVLIEFSGILKKTFASKGIVGRMGGEEFAIFLMGVNEGESLEEAEHLRGIIENSKIAFNVKNQLSFTASIGITFMKKSGIKFEELYKNADAALYRSKESGKNKVTLGNPI